jgi:asparagine synthase (glutamine-hydrolysing)
VHQYEETAEDCLTSLDGMFSVGIWDAARDRLVLARDRMGKKPLYYTVVGGRLLFASEIKGLLAHPDVRRDIDPEGLNLYLTFGNVPAPHTLFLGIKKLPAAHRLICDRLGHIRIQRYWSAVPETPWPSHVSEGEAVATVRELLSAAVKKRLMADVPVGCFLSGGVDSSANVALMSRLIDRPLQTYSVGFEGFGAKENFHDLPYAQAGCQAVRLRPPRAQHHRRRVPRLPPRAGLTSRMNRSAIPRACRCTSSGRQARRDGVIVVLVGEGSDEVFGGYGDMAHILNVASRHWSGIRRLPRFVRAGLHRGQPPAEAARGAHGRPAQGARRSAAVLGPGCRLLGQ